MTKHIKDFYKTYHDHIFDKRYNSPFWLRRYAHRTLYERILRHVEPGQTVLDAGCGDGSLSLLIARKKAIVTGLDMSVQNVTAARSKSSELCLQATFMVGDAEELPFADNSFDLVVSSHVIEHLPDPMKGLRELRRVTRNHAVIAMPTCLSPAAWALLGGDIYWKLSKRSLYAVPLGFCRVLEALVRGREGAQEGYAGKDELPHVWRFPWVMTRMISRAGFQIQCYEADAVLIPYVAHYSSWAKRLQEWLGNWADKPIIKYLGYGSHVICHKN